MAATTANGADTALAQANGGDMDSKSSELLFRREELIVNEKITNEEYKIWKKGAPFMYNVLLVKAMDFPTLSVQWLPSKTPQSPEAQLKEFHTYSLLTGTHTSGATKDSVRVLDMDLPNGNYKGNGGDTNKINKFAIQMQVAHEGEVNRARYDPFNQDQVATLSVSGDALLFDMSNGDKENCKPKKRLKHHIKESYGLCWSPIDKNELLTASEDTTVALWDVAKDGDVIEPSHVLKSHSATVNSVDYSKKFPGVFASASDDATCLIWDKRNLSSSVVGLNDGHDGNGINSVAFNPFSETLVATGSADTTVAVWDLRNPKQPVHSLRGHSGDVSDVRWSPHDESVLASASYDRRLNVWDLSLINDHDEQSVEDANEGPPELLFVHGGHTNKVADFDWHPTLPWTLATASEDNVLQVWQIAYKSVEFNEEEKKEEGDDGNDEKMGDAQDEEKEASS